MRLRKRSNNGSGAGETTLYFATDLHGSEVCFRKFVAAAAFYRADLLVLGGDLTGKLVTPIVDRGDGTWAEIAQLAGAQASEWSWCPIFLDVDLDG